MVSPAGPGAGVPGKRAALSLGAASRAERCRCGTRIPVGGRCWSIPDPPAPIAPMVSKVVFCSQVCVRASLLESLELFASSTAAQVVEEVGRILAAFRELYDGLAATLR